MFCDVEAKTFFLKIVPDFLFRGSIGVFRTLSNVNDGPFQTKIFYGL